MTKYEVRDVVCDYGVFEDGELKLILNSQSNALKIKEILEKDLIHFRDENINVVNEGKNYENVTSKFENMITAFQADFSLATLHNDLDFADFRELIRKKNERLMNDIDLLSELEFKIRHKQIILLEVQEDSQ